MNKRAGFVGVVIVLIIVFLAGAFVAVRVLDKVDETQVNDCIASCSDEDYEYYGVGTKAGTVLKGITAEIRDLDYELTCWCLDEDGKPMHLEDEE